jgi:linoleoyl-CoA desaturase
MATATLKEIENSDFWKETKKEVENYLNQPGVRDRGYKHLHRKAKIIVAWALASYVPLVLSHAWWQTLLCGVSFVLAAGAAGLNIMHDGNHGAFSRSRRVNRLAGMTLEVLGGSSLTWDVSHNRAHHPNPNVDGLDQDIDQPPLARLASSQEWKWWYRWQHLYLPVIYCLVVIRWQTIGDLPGMIRGRIGPYRFKVGARQWCQFLGFKAVFFGWAVVLPLALHSWRWQVLPVALVMDFAFSAILVRAFQYAHCNDEAQFDTVENAESGRKSGNRWAYRQVISTVNWCIDNLLITEYVGGLNYQLEHHLFQREAHTHYPAISQIVRRKCEKYNLPYRCNPTLRSAGAAHRRHLRDMGRRPAKLAA